MQPSSPGHFPSPLPERTPGTNLGFLAIFVGLILCSGIGMSVTGLDTNARAAVVSLESPGIAYVDGRGREGPVQVTRMMLGAPDVRDVFAAGPARRCRFHHGEALRIISEHDGQLHVDNGRCSAWVPVGWLSGTAHPALGLLK